MKAPVHKLAAVLKMAGYLEPNQEEKLAAESGKSLVNILRSELSGQVVKDLMTFEIPLPFAKGKRDRMQAELRRDLSLTGTELTDFFRKHHDRAPDVARLLESVNLLWPGSADEIHDGIRDEGYVFLEQMFREQRLTSEPLAAYIHRDNPITIRNRQMQADTLLVANGMMTEEKATAIRKEMAHSAKPASAILAEIGGISQEDLLSRIKSGMLLPQVDLATIDITAEAKGYFPEDLLHRHLILPIEVTEGGMMVAMSDPLNTSLIDIIAILSGKVISPVFAPQRQILAILQGRIAPSALAEPAEPTADPSKPPSAMPSAEGDDTLLDNVSTVELVSTIIESAFATRATDIHIEPLFDQIRVRYRIDGRLKTILHVPVSTLLPIIARIKVLSDLDVTERRRPQDGHFSLDLGDDSVDLRVSVVPTHLGEKVVIRVLDEANVLRGLDDLGMPIPETERIQRQITRPHGIILACGPTGSGKTTTLYAALNTINSEDINVITIEDPVEYRISGINQIQVDTGVDMTFAAGLRATLRQDPDVIMVGEIRDPETARIATRSALTGHLVLSTLHSNSSAGTISTLRHMGIPAFTLANTINGIISQRLARILCQECCKKIKPSDQLKIDLGLAPSSDHELCEAVGCDNCIETGYSGRRGIFEVWEVTDAMRDVIVEDGPEKDLVKAARADGMNTLMDNAHEMMIQGLTSPEEVLRTVGLD